MPHSTNAIEAAACAICGQDFTYVLRGAARQLCSEACRREATRRRVRRHYRRLTDARDQLAALQAGRAA